MMAVDWEGAVKFTGAVAVLLSATVIPGVIAIIREIRTSTKVDDALKRLDRHGAVIGELRTQLQTTAAASVPPGFITDMTREIAKGAVADALSSAPTPDTSTSAAPTATVTVNTGDSASPSITTTSLDDARREGFQAALDTLQRMQDAGGNPNG